jgi:Tol biopolymer transport system component
MTRRLALLVVLAAFGALLASVAGATRGPGLAVYSVLPDGSGRRLDALIDQSMTFLGRSPDGRRMLVAHQDNFGRTIYVSDLAGTNVVRVSGESGSWAAPAFSPDGSKVALVWFRYCSRPCMLTELYVVDADGSDLRRVLEARGFRGRPSWSPDGTRIVFVDGSGRIKVVRLRDGRVMDLGRGLNAVWAPRGNRIAYIGLRRGYPCFVNADGRNRRCGRGYSATGQLVWSPGGRRVAFQYAPGFMLAVVGADARGLRRFRIRGIPTPLAWSPDGRRLAYTHTFEQQIFVRPVVGPSRAFRVTSGRPFYPNDVRWRAGRISYVAAVEAG